MINSKKVRIKNFRIILIKKMNLSILNNFKIGVTNIKMN